MFQIEPTPWLEGPQNMGPRYGKRVIDHDRDVWLQSIHGSRGPEVTMKLTWRDKVIPFQVALEGIEDDALGGRSYGWRFLSFEGTTSAQSWGYVDPSRGGVPPYYFDDPATRRDAQFLAVEALLIHGTNYNGDKSPDGHYRVEFEGKLYRKSGFGMT